MYNLITSNDMGYLTIIKTVTGRDKNMMKTQENYEKIISWDIKGQHQYFKKNCSRN